MDLENYLSGGNEVTFHIETQLDISKFREFEEEIEEYFMKSWYSELFFIVTDQNGEDVTFQLVSENGYDGEIYLEVDHKRVCQVSDSDDAISEINKVFKDLI